jgi:DNA-binding beta-propeller fold protein YncE
MNRETKDAIFNSIYKPKGSCCLLCLNNIVTDAQNPCIMEFMKNKSYLLISFLIFFSCSKPSKQTSEQYQIENIKKGEIALVHISSFSNKQSELSSAEVIAHDPGSRRLFVANSEANRLDIIDFSDPADMKFFRSVDLNEFGRSINSVAVQNNIVAVVIENHDRQKDGVLCFFDVNGKFIKRLKTGSVPDMVIFTPDGKKILVANEGEPNEEYTFDPEGSVSIIDISKGIALTNQKDVAHLDFRNYNDSLYQFKSKGIRIFGPNASVAQDLEPEYITVSGDSKKAWVTLQENNAIAEININEKKISHILPLGEKTMAMKINGNGSTCSLSDDRSQYCLVKGMYQPDGIASFKIKDKSYIMVANEGDVRKYQGLKEHLKLGSKRYSLDTIKFPNASDLKSKELLGKLSVTRFEGDIDNDGDFDEIHTFGARSFSIFESNKLTEVYNSGNDFEKIACIDPVYSKLNERYSKMQENKFDTRGPEPENVTTGKIGNKTYGFITLERYGGVIVYNISNPSKPYFVQYANINPDNAKSRPEGILFISENESSTKKNYIILANEGMSTVDVYEVKK